MDFIIEIVLVHSIVFGAACYFIGVNRELGPIACAALGVILGTIGLIIVLCSRKVQQRGLSEQLQLYKSLFDNGSISQDEYEELKCRLFDNESSNKSFT